MCEGVGKTNRHKRARDSVRDSSMGRMEDGDRDRNKTLDEKHPGNKDRDLDRASGRGRNRD